MHQKKKLLATTHPPVKTLAKPHNARPQQYAVLVWQISDRNDLCLIEFCRAVCGFEGKGKKGKQFVRVFRESQNFNEPFERIINATSKVLAVKTIFV